MALSSLFSCFHHLFQNKKMDACIVHPPLGTTTLFHHSDSILFTLFVPTHLQVYVAEVWTDLSPDHHWHAVQFFPDPHPPPIYTTAAIDNGEDQLNSQKTFRLFHARVTSPLNEFEPGWYKFCIRVRENTNGSWIYLGYEGENRDGIIFLRPDKDHIEFITSPIDLFANPSQELSISSPISSLSDTIRWWTFSARVHASKRGALSTVSLGRPSGAVRCVSLSRSNPWWLFPAVGTSPPTDRDSHFILTQCADGYYSLIIPITTQTCWTAVRAQRDGTLILRCINETGREQTALVSISVGYDPLVLIDRTMDYIIKNILERERRDHNKGTRRSVYDRYLGYCTWNAFMKEVSYDHILESLASLREHSIPVRYLVIDDGWLTQKDDLIRSFEANPAKFPLGMRDSIAEIRRLHPEIDAIGVWHTLWGYWRGVDPKSRLAEHYKIIPIPKGRMHFPVGLKAYIVSGIDIHQFYDDFYSFLSNAGINMVKVDNQGAFDTHDIAAIGEEDGGEGIVTEYETAMRKAARRHFGYQLIYCMGMVPKHFFSTYSTPPPKEDEADEGHEVVPLMRNSDDFYPNNARSHPRHIWANALNSLWTHTFQRVNSDWDMFQSAHPWAHFHGVARALSGGPVYITDHPNKHDPIILHRLVAHPPNGPPQILRSPTPALPTLDSLFADPTALGSAPLKIFNTNGEWAIVAAFNSHPATDIASISLSDARITSSTPYVAYLFMTGTTLKLSSSTEKILVAILPRGCEVVTFAPLHTLKIPNFSANIACFGLVDKYNSPQPIISAKSSPENPLAYCVKLATRSRKCVFWLENESDTKIDVRVVLDGEELDSGRVRYVPENSTLNVNLFGDEPEQLKYVEDEKEEKEQYFEVVVEIIFL